MNVLIFAIHTIPDTETGSRKYQLEGLDEKNAIKAMLHLQQQSGRSELPHYMQRIVAISTIFRGHGVTLEINSLGEGRSEKQLLAQFFKTLNRNNLPRFVSWNGLEKDVPVLMYRCLKHEIPLSLLLQTPLLSLRQELGYGQQVACTSQQNIMHLLGLESSPALMPQDIQALWQQENMVAIQASCTWRALDTYRIFLRYQYITDAITWQHYEREMHHIDRLVAQRLGGYGDSTKKADRNP